ncbi:hypothetical protein C6Y45_10650, partial [Alkalicoccus saliphilus]
LNTVSKTQHTKQILLRVGREPVSICGFNDPGVPTTSLPFYKKSVAQTMALVCATNVSMFPGGPASANFFLPNGSSARPLSPRSRLLQLQQKNKKKVSLLKNVLIPPFLPFRRSFFLRNVRWRCRWDKAKSEDPTRPQGKQLTPGSAGESCTLKRIIILKSRLNQHSEKILDPYKNFVPDSLASFQRQIPLKPITPDKGTVKLYKKEMLS